MEGAYGSACAKVPAGPPASEFFDRMQTHTSPTDGAAPEAAPPFELVCPAGSLPALKAAVDAGATAVAAGAYFVLHGPHRAVLITYPKYRDLEQLFAR